jgi:hypothetical protein
MRGPGGIFPEDATVPSVLPSSMAMISRLVGLSQHRTELLFQIGFTIIGAQNDRY